ncbi:MAG: hypothetical protein PSN34_04890 [Urechidicola sp.]|nr:hypothetical protein [Urechidicola sp.]
MKRLPLLLLLILSSSLFAQDIEENFTKEKKGNKGKMYVIWGWNRASYSDSDITFKGDDYNFTLHDVAARDKVTPFSYEKYIRPDNITIPQTNFRVGYFISDHYTISGGVDHMKYVMHSYQTVKIDGEISNETIYDGVYNNDDILLTHEFLTFEHTDGLNYINLELNRFDNLNELLKFDTGFMDVNLTEGIGGGIIFPKTNTTLMGSERYDEFNVAGYGLSAKVGLNLTFWNHFFIQSDYKVGYINMNNIRTTASTSDSASQDFTFFEATFMLGLRFQLINQE